jgi:hypothetical protein
MRSWAALLGAALAVCGGCGGDEPLAPTCTVTAPAGAERVDPAAVAVHFDAAGDHADVVRADVARYLGALWGAAPTIAGGRPADAATYALWLSTDDEARALVGEPGPGGYALRRIDDGGRVRIVAWAADEHALAYAAYALLEELGARFFHPREELVPALDGAWLPRALDVTRTPAFATRGLQLHTLHPIETMAELVIPGEENLARAKQLVDWLVKTGHNQLQWYLFEDLDAAAYGPYLDALTAHAHRRGVRLGVIAQLWGGSSLQNAFALVHTEAGWQSELEAQLDVLLDLGFDMIEIALGEFLAADPDRVVEWLDHATALAASRGVELSVINHVGNQPELWVDYQGEQVFFYHLPGFADPRLTNSVHTVFFFDLYRPWAGYGHPDFGLQREFLLGELGERPVRYHPESAYWATADIDVPLFLPSYLYARWLDVTGLYADTMGLEPIEGHVLFSSGHEWGYWLTDYLTARMLWQPEAPFESFLHHAALGFGSCAGEVETGLSELVAAQNEYLFDRRLVGFLSGEDAHDDFGELSGFETTPRRPAFEDVMALAPPELADFEADAVLGLDEASAAFAAVESRLGAVCALPDAALDRWCRELHDGAAIVRLRAQHAAELYRAVIAAARGGDAGVHLGQARGRIDEALGVVARREPFYRGPAERLVGAYKNPTIYDFGYLHQTHELCLWLRQQEQAQTLIETGSPASFVGLRSCVD